MTGTGTSLRRRALLVAAATVATAVLAGCSAQQVDQTAPGRDYAFTGATPAGTVVAPGGRAPAPPFSGELLDGSRFSSAELAGSIAVINFWGSWCAPCRLETPELQALHADLADRGVQFLGVDVKDERQLAVAFYRRLDE